MIPSNVAVECWKLVGFDDWKMVSRHPKAHLTLSEGMRADLSGPKFRHIVTGAKVESITTSYGGSGNDLHLKLLVPNADFSKWTVEKWYVSFLR